MRVPIRRSERNVQKHVDLHITQEKFDELERKLTRLKVRRREAADEVKRLAEMGDFSENAAYQIAKGRLRGINHGMLETENLLRHAVIVTPQVGSRIVQLGHTVTVAVGGKEKQYRILGSAEADPARGIISQHSPIGKALLGRCIGDRVKVQLKEQVVTYHIIRINIS